MEEGKEKSGNVIRIGGIPRQYEILHHMMLKYLVRWNSQYEICKRDFKTNNGRDYVPDKDRLVIPNDFYLWVVWKCLKKKGLFFKKPFRSRRHMRKHIWRDEFPDIVDFVNKKILDQ